MNDVLKGLKFSTGALIAILLIVVVCSCCGLLGLGYTLIQTDPVIQNVMQTIEP